MHFTPVLHGSTRPRAAFGESGGLDARGKPLDGIELGLDRVLRGDSARVTLARKHGRRPLETPDAWSDPPRAGSTVTLTINSGLHGTSAATAFGSYRQPGASAADNRRDESYTGEILAMATNRAGRNVAQYRGDRAIRAGLEPNPFVAAALLAARSRPAPTR